MLAKHGRTGSEVDVSCALYPLSCGAASCVVDGLLVVATVLRKTAHQEKYFGVFVSIKRIFTNGSSRFVVELQIDNGATTQVKAWNRAWSAGIAVVRSVHSNRNLRFWPLK